MSAYDEYVQDQLSGQNDPTEFTESVEETALRLSREWRRRNRNNVRLMQLVPRVIADEVEESQE